MATEFERTQAQRYRLGKLFGRPAAKPEFCRENFALQM
jgi:hypothetical protein